MNDAARRRLVGAGALLAAGAALAFIAFADLGENLVYYWSPTELMSKTGIDGATVRLGGMVVPGSLDWDRDAQRATFSVTDGNQVVPVRCKGNPPAMFREGVGVVVEGKLEAGVFHTDRVMVKHSNEYRAPGDGERADKVFETLVMDDEE